MRFIAKPLYMGIEVDESLAFDLLSEWSRASSSESERLGYWRSSPVMLSDRDGSPKIGGEGPGCFDEARMFDSHAASFTTIGTPYLSYSSFSKSNMKRALEKRSNSYSNKFSNAVREASSTAKMVTCDEVICTSTLGAPSNDCKVGMCGSQQSGELGSSQQALDGIHGVGQANSSVLSQLASEKKALRASRQSGMGRFNFNSCRQ
ncbi:aspartic proteinase-like protein 2 [Tanacetum coccineum]